MKLFGGGIFGIQPRWNRIEARMVGFPLGCKMLVAQVYQFLYVLGVGWKRAVEAITSPIFKGWTVVFFGFIRFALPSHFQF